MMMIVVGLSDTGFMAFAHFSYFHKYCDWFFVCVVLSAPSMKPLMLVNWILQILKDDSAIILC